MNNAIVLKNRTSTYFNKLSNKVKKSITKKRAAYSPSINKLLVSLPK